MQAQTISAITNALSDARFDTYRAAAGGSEAKALKLYLWNITMAGAVTATTGIVEVQLRNSIDTRLQSWNETEPVHEPGRSSSYSRDWLIDPAPKLKQLSRQPTGSLYGRKLRLHYSERMAPPRKRTPRMTIL